MTAEPESFIGHGLPRWYGWVQRHIVLSLLILAEVYVNGVFATVTLVDNLADPGAWSWLDWAGVIIFFAAIGVGVAGVSLGLSIRMIESFQTRKYGMASFSLFGLLIFSSIEIWATLAERSLHEHPTPADSGLLTTLGYATASVTPSVVMIALLLPFAVMFYGLASRPPKVMTVQDKEQSLADARFKAELRAIKVRGSAGLARALREGWTGEEVAPNISLMSDTEPEFESEPDPDFPSYLTTNQVKRALRFKDESQVRELCRKGTILATKEGDEWRIHTGALKAHALYGEKVSRWLPREQARLARRTQSVRELAVA